MYTQHIRLKKMKTILLFFRNQEGDDITDITLVQHYKEKKINFHHHSKQCTGKLRFFFKTTALVNLDKDTHIRYCNYMIYLA
jgi:hypothetical protein